jgi:hypothetical protein
MLKLEEIDKSELLEQTKGFTHASTPKVEDKKKVWDGLLGTDYDDKSLLVHSNICSGLSQRVH